MPKYCYVFQKKYSALGKHQTNCYWIRCNKQAAKTGAHLEKYLEAWAQFFHVGFLCCFRRKAHN